jgi:hypothetical protein
MKPIGAEKQRKTEVKKGGNKKPNKKGEKGNKNETQKRRQRANIKKKPNIKRQ